MQTHSINIEHDITCYLKVSCLKQSSEFSEDGLCRKPCAVEIIVHNFYVHTLYIFDMSLKK